VTSDAIVLLKDDHKAIRRLFREFQRAGDRAVKKKGRLVGQIIERLTVHTYIENEVMYPKVRTLLPELEDDVLESYEEHHVADVLCMELAAMAPDAEHFDAKATVLIESRTGSPRSGPAWAVSSFRTSGPSSSWPGVRRRETLPSPVR